MLSRSEDDDGRRYDGNDAWVAHGSYATSVTKQRSRRINLEGNALAKAIMATILFEPRAPEISRLQTQNGTRPEGWYFESGRPDYSKPSPLPSSGHSSGDPSEVHELDTQGAEDLYVA